MTMNSPAVAASKAQWLQYFAAGNRTDIPYNLSELLTATKAGIQLAVEGALAIRDPSIALLSVLGAYTIAEDRTFAQNYFGDAPAGASLGISGAGLHLPTIPVLPWEAIGAIVISNQQSVMVQAANSSILQMPPVGNTSGAFRFDSDFLTVISIVTADGHATRRLVADQRYAGVVDLFETPQGNAIGQVLPQLDPYLGPEQIVEFLFLLHLSAEARGIKVYQVKGFPELLQRVVDIGQLN